MGETGAANPQIPATSSASTSSKPTNPRETDEYKAARELELWRHEQKQKFTKSLADERARTITALKDEFRRRELERESSYRKKLLEYEKLEAQLRKGVRDLE